MLSLPATNLYVVGPRLQHHDGLRVGSQCKDIRSRVVCHRGPLHSATAFYTDGVIPLERYELGRWGGLDGFDGLFQGIDFLLGIDQLRAKNVHVLQWDRSGFKLEADCGAKERNCQGNGCLFRVGVDEVNVCAVRRPIVRVCITCCIVAIRCT